MTIWVRGEDRILPFFAPMMCRFAPKVDPEYMKKSPISFFL